MTNGAVHERLSRMREATGEDLVQLSRRTGIPVRQLRAIEEGRFADLPPGIYARNAIRAFAAAYALDADQVLADCEPLLPRLEDPIGALARMCAGARIPEPVGDTRDVTVTTGQPRWRPLAAASVDGSIAGALLVVTSAGAATLSHVSVGSLGSSAVSLFLVGLVLGGAYYVWLGGLGGTTFGEYAVGPEPRCRDPRPLTLRAITLRTIAAATADARTIHALGHWIGRRFRPAGAADSAPPPAPSLSPPPPHGREEVLTWSMSRRASVPPPPLHPRRG